MPEKYTKATLQLEWESSKGRPKNSWQNELVNKWPMSLWTKPYVTKRQGSFQMTSGFKMYIEHSGLRCSLPREFLEVFVGFSIKIKNENGDLSYNRLHTEINWVMNPVKTIECNLAEGHQNQKQWKRPHREYISTLQSPTNALQCDNYLWRQKNENIAVNANIKFYKSYLAII